MASVLEQIRQMRRLNWVLGICVLGTGLMLALGVRAADSDDEGDVPYVPTPHNVVDEMLKMANVSSNDVVYDLGCGDGRIVVTAAKKYGARGVGVDIDPDRIAESRDNARKAGVTNRVSFKVQDLFETDLRDASVVTLYLLPDVNTKLRPRLLSQLEPGSRVVSHSFDMDEWEADQKKRIVEEEGSKKIVDVGDLSSQFGISFDSEPGDEGGSTDDSLAGDLLSENMTWEATLYKWVIPAEFEGTWHWTMAQGDRKTTYAAVLKQDFQMLNGHVVTPDQERLRLNKGLIHGYEVDFTVPGGVGDTSRATRFHGVLNPKTQTIKGRMVQKSGGSSKTNQWRAVRLAPEE